MDAREMALDIAESAFRRFTRDTLLLVLVVATSMTPACLLEESEIPSSSDGRYAACGVVTEHGVTEYLDAYADRCGGGR